MRAIILRRPNVRVYCTDLWSGRPICEFWLLVAAGARRGRGEVVREEDVAIFAHAFFFVGKCIGDIRSPFLNPNKNPVTKESSGTCAGAACISMAIVRRSEHFLRECLLLGAAEERRMRHGGAHRVGLERELAGVQRDCELLRFCVIGGGCSAARARAAWVVSGTVCQPAVT